MKTATIVAAFLAATALCRPTSVFSSPIEMVGTISGRGFIAIETAYRELLKRLPESRIEDYRMEVYELDDGLVVIFTDAEAPPPQEGMAPFGQQGDLPQLEVTLSKDGRTVITSAFSK